MTASYEWLTELRGMGGPVSCQGQDDAYSFVLTRGRDVLLDWLLVGV